MDNSLISIYMQIKIEEWLENSTKTKNSQSGQLSGMTFSFLPLRSAFKAINVRVTLSKTQKKKKSWGTSVPFAEGFITTQPNKCHCLCFESSPQGVQSFQPQAVLSLKAVTLNSWASGFPVETEVLHLINNNVSPSVPSPLMRCIKESEHYCFQRPLHHHAKISKWWKHWMIFFQFFFFWWCSTFGFRGEIRNLAGCMWNTDGMFCNLLSVWEVSVEWKSSSSPLSSGLVLSGRG